MLTPDMVYVMLTYGILLLLKSDLWPPAGNLINYSTLTEVQIQKTISKRSPEHEEVYNQQNLPGGIYSR